MLVQLVNEIAHTDRPFERKGGIESTPGKRKGAGATGLRSLTASEMTNAGKFTFHRMPISPIFGVCHQSQARCRFEEKGSHVFVGQHWFSPRRPFCNTLLLVFLLRRASILAIWRV